MAAGTSEDAQTRDLYNALRTGDVGVRCETREQGGRCCHVSNRLTLLTVLLVSFEAVMCEIYFLQHRHFTLFDAKDAFHSSTGTLCLLLIN